MMSADTVLPYKKAPVEYLSADLDYITEELEMKAKTELFEDQNARVQSMKLLRSMLEAEEGLRWQNDDLFLLAFLRARKFDVKKAFKILKGFYTGIGKHRDIFYKFNLDFMKTILEERLFSMLPYRDRENSVIVLLRCCSWDYSNFCAKALMAFCAVVMIQALRSPSTQIAGFQMIFDFTGFTMRHALYATPAGGPFFMDLAQYALPFRLKGFHMVNETPLFSYVWPFVKLCASKKLQERIHFHGNDMESLHKFFHPSLLPADLGGELQPSYYEDWQEKMEASSDYINHVFSHGYEKYRRNDCNK